MTLFYRTQTYISPFFWSICLLLLSINTSTGKTMPEIADSDHVQNNVEMPPPPEECDYILELIDSFGDGWNGGVLTITVNGIATDYTLDNINDDGTFNAITVSIPDSASVQFEYQEGGFPTEVSYNFINPNFETIFSDGPGPATGLVFDEELICPTCIVPTDVMIDEIGAIYTDISWTPSSSPGQYLVQYGVQGMPLDSFTNFLVDGSSTTLSPLMENTTYEFYLTLFCEGGEMSPALGPFEFTTIWLNDLGIAAVLTPATDCALGNETVTVTITNYGQLPQTLFDFSYSVNGVPASIPMFTDGFFTDVIGLGDTVEIEFETMFDFSASGNYTIAAWTELEEEGNLSNDTAFLEIINIPVIADFPYFNDFESGDGGWAVDENGENSSWAFGNPAAPVISAAASGQNAWVTNLAGDYNVNERSFLVSPCFDFSTLTVDPVISFSINFDTETTWDGGWLEGSKDGGATWEKIGTIGSGDNWYNIENTNIDLGDVWAGDSDGWVNAEHILDGFAGEASSLFRFAFGSDGSVTNDGIGIDDIFISPPLANDLATESASVDASTDCGQFTETVIMEILNDGIETQTGFDVFYQVDNETPVMENVGALSLTAGMTGSYTFTQPFTFVEGTYSVKVWTNLPVDDNNSNDTTSFEVTVIPFVADYPYFVDFESGTGGWTIDDNSANPSWAFGAPDNNVISEAASGVNAWVTNLTGNYNVNELSFVVSPCFDFSAQADDPVINFAINFATETNWDGGWLEGSKDGGANWEKIGAIGTGVNWYTITNTNIDLGDVWAGNSGGWINAEHVLDGYAGEANCSFRFAFGSDGSVTLEGIGLDDIFISPPLPNDLAAINVDHTASSNCGSIMDSVILEIRNPGTLAQTGFDVYYQVDGAAPVMENVGALNIEPGETGIYTFTQTFDSRIFDNTFEVRGWVALSNEQNEANDSTDFSFTTITPDVLPLAVDFENVALPGGWTSTGFVDDGHNAPSFVLTSNLFEFNTDFEMVSFPIGPINAGDSLTFDYRYVDFPDGTGGTILGDNQMQVQISSDCGNTFNTVFTVDDGNHIASTDMANRTVDLDPFAGEYITIRIIATWAEGDYFLDLDNINIIGCPESLAIDADISPESEVGASDGGIFIDPLQGIGPYEYLWSTGDMTAVITNLTSDTYTVTVTDVNGCMDVSSFEIVVCPENLNIDGTVNNESSAGASDGSITVTPLGGVGPYEYLWNTGDETATLSGLTMGTYTVMVTDANGCSETIDYVIDIQVAVTDLDFISSLSLRPNPTNHSSTLFLEFETPVDVQVRLHNMLGQTLLEAQRTATQRANFPLDLSQYSSGMYLVTIQVGDKIHVERLILTP